ncbi:cob(I)yrinic acid a,c-diamide adenosyltransferase [Microbacter margulisiae]|uniref:Corrinoid adenosyltransferase n=1 Tax=Microbacter margulisiae TaxID=1350067 RepID=A0A7W5DQN1_9PORP|nr:cob(I)yrinic acid a,c-diamide adenosyltransferase [Microbacter margulisiae]MBB3186938.1 cob(I)alamin adenosyltransferase [Microbacter margulisiae]
MKVYTKTGDSGSTGLIGGTRVSKTDERLEAYGTVDELNSNVGLLIAKLANKESIRILSKIQNLLFDLGVELATDKSHPGIKQKNDGFVKATGELESLMDVYTQQLPPLTGFILPSGSESVAQCHVCRTIARRAERRIWEVHSHYPVDKDCLVFINRLSDFFFVFARKIALDENSAEILWKSLCWY